MNYYIKTFGCQMNVSDSERIAGFLEKHGLEKASDIKEADLVVFNTCGVRQMAEDRVYGQVHNLGARTVERGTKNIKPKIVLTGCLAHRKDVQRRLKNKVDLFVSIKDFQKEVGKLFSPLPPTPSPGGRGWSEGAPKYNSKHTAYVPIMTGCNNFCAYCVVPYARGREVSRPVGEIIKEVKNLVKRGSKEIFLLGQNVNSYLSPLPSTPSPAGRGRGEGVNFSELLQKINSIPGKFWIRFMSNHPKDFSDELIEIAAKLPKVCECIHLPIQAGDDAILKKMNRKYTSAEYLELIDKIKKSFKKYKPNALYALTSDIIVGFPGETRKQFLKSAEVMKRAKYDLVYFGQFSPRPETAAWKMKDNVSQKEKGRREKYLNEILKKTALENNKKYVGKIVEILVERKEVGLPFGSPTSKYIYFGKTRTMKNVKIVSEKKNLVGKFVKVKITNATSWSLEGKLSSRA